MYNIIMFNMSPSSDWDEGIVNRNYFILKNLAQQPEINKIVAVDFLPMRGRKPLGLTRVIKYIIESLSSKKEKELFYQDFTAKCWKDSKIYFYSTINLYFSKKLFFQELSKLLNKFDFFNSGIKTIVWSYNPLFIDYFDDIKSDLKIFDAVDNWSFHNSYKHHKDKLIKNYDLISKKADIIFTVAEDLLNLFHSHNNVHWIPNGVDWQYFQKVSPKPVLPKEKPIIGYVGTIQKRVDIDLIKYIAENNPDKAIIMGGPLWMDVLSEFENKIKPLKNVFWRGRIKYQDLPDFINQFDVAIIPHRIDQFIKSTNPLKMYDYLALGKPVVTTRGAGVEMFENLIYVADSYDEFNRKIQEALTEDRNLSAKRIEAIKGHSWQNRVTKMLQMINDFRKN